MPKNPAVENVQHSENSARVFAGAFTNDQKQITKGHHDYIRGIWNSLVTDADMDLGIATQLCRELNAYYAGVDEKYAIRTRN